jgi:hypothetical protein
MLFGLGYWSKWFDIKDNSLASVMCTHNLKAIHSFYIHIIFTQPLDYNLHLSSQTTPIFQPNREVMDGLFPSTY